MNALELTQQIIRRCLQLGPTVPLTEETYLMGEFAEFNSLTITTMIGEIEDATGSDVDDDEISAETFETVGSLRDFIASKLGDG